MITLKNVKETPFILKVNGIEIERGVWDFGTKERPNIHNIFIDISDTDIVEVISDESIIVEKKILK